MKNPFSTFRPQSTDLYLNKLAQSRQPEINQAGEAIGILHHWVEVIWKKLQSADWTVLGRLFVGAGAEFSSGSLLTHSSLVLVDEQGKQWIQIHEGTALPDTVSWGMEHRGYLFRHLTYFHTLLWNGTGWEYLDPGDPGGRFALSAVDLGDGWVECDGSPASADYLKGDGTTASVTLPDASTASGVWVFTSYIPSGGTFGAAGSTYPDFVFRLFFRL